MADPDSLWGFTVGQAVEVYMATSNTWVIATVTGVTTLPGGRVVLVHTANRPGMQSTFHVSKPTMLRHIPRDSERFEQWLES